MFLSPLSLDYLQKGVLHLLSRVKLGLSLLWNDVLSRSPAEVFRKPKAVLFTTAQLGALIEKCLLLNNHEADCQGNLL